MKVYIETMGCPKNQSDSQAAAGLLEKCGHEIVPSPSEADAVMVNTCGFINDAKEESIGKIFEMASYGKLLIVSGCLSQRYGQELFDLMPEADIMLGVNDYDRLPGILDSYESGLKNKGGDRCRELHVSLRENDLPSADRRIPDLPYTSVLKISEGCDKKCTYCAIPSIRGGYRSFPEADLIREAGRLAAAGTRELVLVAEDTASYGCDFDEDGNRVPEKGERPKLAGLLRKLCRIDGIEWIRIMYAYEEGITDELIDVIAEEPKICKYIDIPLQHASDRVLRRMGRPSTNLSIRNTLKKLRDRVKDIHIRTTFITGFPGETEEDMDELMELVSEEKFDRLGVFAYSPEEGTPAAEMPDQTDEQTKAERLDEIMLMQMDISLEANRRMIGGEYEVIIDEKDEDEGVYTGRTRYDAPEIDNTVIVNARTRHVPGDIIKVRITDAFDYDIVGEEI